MPTIYTPEQDRELQELLERVPRTPSGRVPKGTYHKLARKWSKTETQIANRACHLGLTKGAKRKHPPKKPGNPNIAELRSKLGLNSNYYLGVAFTALCRAGLAKSSERYPHVTRAIAHLTAWMKEDRT